jgi:hypothetical protein
MSFPFADAPAKSGAGDWYDKKKYVPFDSSPKKSQGLGIPFGAKLQQLAEADAGAFDRSYQQRDSAGGGGDDADAISLPDIGPTSVFLPEKKPKRQESIIVPHAAGSDGSGGNEGAAPAPLRFMALRELNRVNFLVDYGIKLTEDDDVDLDHTSCEEEEELVDDDDDDEPLPPAVPLRPSTSVPGNLRRLPDDISCESETPRRSSVSVSSYRPSGASGENRSVEAISSVDRAAAAYYANQPDDDDDDDDDDDPYRDSPGGAAAGDEAESESLVRGGSDRSNARKHKQPDAAAGAPGGPRGPTPAGPRAATARAAGCTSVFCVAGVSKSTIRSTTSKCRRCCA